MDLVFHSKHHPFEKDWASLGKKRFPFELLRAKITSKRTRTHICRAVPIRDYIKTKRSSPALVSVLDPGQLIRDTLSPM